MLNKFIKGIAPAAIAILSLGLSGCNVDMNIGDMDGVPLAELDMSGDAPNELVLAGPDTVIISDGEELAIDVEGDDKAKEALRFSLDDGTLGISREKDTWDKGGSATIRVTMPSPKAMVLAGSGSIEAASLASDSSITIAGSGSASVASVEAETLELTVAGSGGLAITGTAKELEATIAGAGSAKMPDLKVETAEVTIAGSGDIAFASDGDVDANIVGSGNVTVTGSATCTVSSIGSGKVTCKNVKAEDDTKNDADENANENEDESEDA
jgi:hypothetical protein